MLRRTFASSLIVLLACSLFLASSNINVSASASQIYWGAWVGNSHIGNYNLLTTFENQVGKNVSIWNWIQLWNRPKDSENTPTFDVDLMNQAKLHGAIPMISWAPEASDKDPNFVNFQSILDGKEDAYLTAWGQASAAWGHPYFVRLMWEFTGSWTDNTPQNPGSGYYPWGNGNTPSTFVAAWQYIVDKVRATGGTQISWVWCPGNVGDTVNTLRSVYPGDTYVDWVGTDIYVGARQTFEQEAQPELMNIQTVAMNKPVMLPETGYTGSNSGLYWSNLLNNLLPNSYSYIKAVLIWEMPSAGITVVDSATLPSFKHGIASNYFSSNIYGFINISPITANSENPNPTASTSTYPYPSASPLNTSTHTNVPSVSLSWFIAFLLIVIASASAVAVVLSKLKKRKDAQRMMASS